MSSHEHGNVTPNHSEHERESDNKSPMESANNDSQENTKIDESSASSFSPSVNEMKVLSITAPPGSLGMLLKNGQYLNKGCVVSGLRDSSPLLGKLAPGDIIVAIDDEDVSSMSVKELSTVISNKVDNTRVITAHSYAAVGSMDSSVTNNYQVSLKEKGKKKNLIGGVKPGAVAVSGGGNANHINSAGLKTSKIDDRRSSNSHEKDKRIKERFRILRDSHNKKSEEKVGNVSISPDIGPDPKRNDDSSVQNTTSTNDENTSTLRVINDVAGTGFLERSGANQGATPKEVMPSTRNSDVEKFNVALKNGAQGKNQKRKKSFFIGLVLSTLLVIGGIIVPVSIAVKSKKSKSNISDPREPEVIAPFQSGPSSNVWSIDFALFYLCGSGTEGKLSRDQKSNLEEALILYANTINKDVNFTAANVANFVQPECCHAVDVTSACIDALFDETETIVDFDLTGQCSVLCEGDALPPEDSVRVLRELQRRENRRLFVEIIQRTFNETLATVQVAQVEEQVLLPCAIGSNECDVEGSCCGMEGCLCKGVSTSLCDTNKCDLPGGGCCNEEYPSCLDSYSEVCTCQNDLGCASYFDERFFSDSEPFEMVNYTNCCQYRVCEDTSSCQCDLCSDGSSFDRDEKFTIDENEFTCDFLEASGNYATSMNETTCDAVHLYGSAFCDCPAPQTAYDGCIFCSTFNRSQEIIIDGGTTICGDIQLALYENLIENATSCNEEAVALTKVFGNLCGCPLEGNNAELPDGVEACSLCKGAELRLFEDDFQSICKILDTTLGTLAADDERCVDFSLKTDCCMENPTTFPSSSPSETPTAFPSSSPSETPTTFPSSSPSIAVPYESIWNMTIEIDYSCGEYTSLDEGIPTIDEIYFGYRYSALQTKSNLESSLLDYANQLSLTADKFIDFNAANIAYFQPPSCSTSAPTPNPTTSPNPTPNPIFSGTLARAVQVIGEEVADAPTFAPTTSSIVIYSLTGTCSVQCNDLALPNDLSDANLDTPSFAAISTNYSLPTTRNFKLISQRQLDCTQGTLACISGACCGFESCACQTPLSDTLCATHSCELQQSNGLSCACLSTSDCYSDICFTEYYNYGT